MTQEQLIRQREYNKKYRLSNKGKLWEKNYIRNYKERYQREKEKRKKWQQNNKEWLRDYRQRNKETLSVQEKNRMLNPNYRIAKLLRSRVWGVLKNKRKSASTITLLGCTVEEFKNYFESKFTDGMTWFLFISGEIHIDHIRPCCSFNLEKEEEQRRCFHYSNLQPLWATTRVINGITYIGNINKNDKYYINNTNQTNNAKE